MPFVLLGNNNKTNGLSFELKAEKISVGRDPKSSIFLQDSCVSRNHAEFVIQTKDKVSIRDLKSTFGTFLNNVKLVPHVCADISVGDVIGFGEAGSSEFRFDSIPSQIVLCSSGLNSREKDALKRLSANVGAQCLEDMDLSRVTHLVLPSKKWPTTTKLLLGLLAQVIIVTLEWVEEFGRTKQYPDTKRFQPGPLSLQQMDSLSIMQSQAHLTPANRNITVDFSRRVERRSLFQNVVVSPSLSRMCDCQLELDLLQQGGAKFDDSAGVIIAVPTVDEFRKANPLQAHLRAIDKPLIIHSILNITSLVPVEGKPLEPSFPTNNRLLPPPSGPPSLLSSKPRQMPVSHSFFSTDAKELEGSFKPKIDQGAKEKNSRLFNAIETGAKEGNLFQKPKPIELDTKEVKVPQEKKPKPIELDTKKVKVLQEKKPKPIELDTKEVKPLPNELDETAKISKRIDLEKDQPPQTDCDNQVKSLQERNTLSIVEILSNPKAIKPLAEIKPSHLVENDRFMDSGWLRAAGPNNVSASNENINILVEVCHRVETQEAPRNHTGNFKRFRKNTIGSQNASVVVKPQRRETEVSTEVPLADQIAEDRMKNDLRAQEALMVNAFGGTSRPLQRGGAQPPSRQQRLVVAKRPKRRQASSSNSSDSSEEIED